MYIAIDLENNTANGYKDLKMAAESIKTTYKTAKRHLDKVNYYSKGQYRLYKGSYFKSNRGNPMF